MELIRWNAGAEGVGARGWQRDAFEVERGPEVVMCKVVLDNGGQFLNLRRF